MESKNIKKKIANAKPSTWLTEGLTKEEIEEALAEGDKMSSISATMYGQKLQEVKENVDTDAEQTDNNKQ
jgi:hypothetical protein